ncbi:hypothetical protein PA08_0248 [Cutibacterium modestum P08]|nr:hypothetical protein PA08_0248 [Cutibacterium modestum P08]
MRTASGCARMAIFDSFACEVSDSVVNCIDILPLVGSI